jgi:hypothetical protein
VEDSSANNLKRYLRNTLFIKTNNPLMTKVYKNQAANSSAKFNLKLNNLSKSKIRMLRKEDQVIFLLLQSKYYRIKLVETYCLSINLILSLKNVRLRILKTYIKIHPNYQNMKSDKASDALLIQNNLK